MKRPRLNAKLRPAHHDEPVRRRGRACGPLWLVVSGPATLVRHDWPATGGLGDGHGAHRHRADLVLTEARFRSSDGVSICADGMRRVGSPRS
ncbi:predicted protein [Streptomyces filamentosus NRRL 15998]|uniref:Predicted protein n=1 Tax=Streptomyces filamentosus NRRL 15998 TaxID=457431 RepID=D6AME0_STRFL|nr:predicted protein [Streptomyces filamentosus NRRL 15998]